MENIAEVRGTAKGLGLGVILEEAWMDGKDNRYRVVKGEENLDRDLTLERVVSFLNGFRIAKEA